jgi:hypothetical protein
MVDADYLLGRGSNGYYWSNTQFTNIYGTGLYFTSTYGYVSNYNNKQYGFSMRCLRDPNGQPVTVSVSTATISHLGETTAFAGGKVTCDGGTAVIARGVCLSLSLNPTISDYHTTNGSGVGVFTSSLAGLSPNTHNFVRAYAMNTTDTALRNTVSFTTKPAFLCGANVEKNHLVIGGVAPTNKTVIYGTVTNIPGEPSKCWITSNLGAYHTAFAVNDDTQASAGWYWQFNLKQGYEVISGTNRTPNTPWITNPGCSNTDWIADNDPCLLLLGNGWRIPTKAEWSNVSTTGGWTNWNGPWSSGLHLHAAGYLNYEMSGFLEYSGSVGGFWSSTHGVDGYSWYLLFDSGSSGL